jgi:hypothetical protein
VPLLIFDLDMIPIPFNNLSYSGAVENLVYEKIKDKHVKANVCNGFVV